MPCLVRDGAVLLFVIDKEFEYNGHVAQWAPPHDKPRFWDQEHRSMPMSKDLHLLVDLPTSPDDDRSAVSAITQDGRYLAIATNKVIRIYDTETRILVDTLVGHEETITGLVFTVMTRMHDGHLSINYDLYSQSLPERQPMARGSISQRKTIYVWPINSSGRYNNTSRPYFNANAMTQTAMNSLRNLTPNDEIGSVEEDLSAVFRNVAIRSYVQGSSKITGRFPSSASKFCSHDGRVCAIIRCIDQGPKASPPLIDLPDVLVCQRDETNLRTDSFTLGNGRISWVGWSLDDKFFVATGTNGYYALWDLGSRTVKSMVGPLKGSIWGGAFLPDGNLILSVGKPLHIAVYEPGTGRELAVLKLARGIELHRGLAYFAVNPKTGLVLICNGPTLLAWEPMQEGSPPAQEVFVMHAVHSKSSNSKGALWRMNWVDGGNKMLAQGCHGHVIFLWDVKKNLKWRFEDHEGGNIGSIDAYFVKINGEDQILSVDGDDKVRFWKLSD